MFYDSNEDKAARYSAQFRKDGKCENRPGQNVVSHTSNLEHGHYAKGVKRKADWLEQMPVYGDDDK